MSDASPRSRWLFLLSPRWLTWHAFSVVAAVGMLLLGDWQWHRAETGNALSWAYTFEWPIFAIFVMVFWVKTIVDEGRHPGGQANEAQSRGAAGLAADDDLSLPGAPHTAAETDDEAADDPELAAYNAYLARLNRGATREEAGNAP
jgi:hypothetical protein